MFNNRYFFSLITAGLLLISSKAIVAQTPTKSPARTETTISRISFKPPSDDKQPDRTAGAGARGGWCREDAIVSNASTPPLMALVPTTNAGLTLAQRPTFWVYLPKTSAKQIVLNIKKEGIQQHSQTFFSIAGRSGIIGLKPSEDSPPLEAGKTYQWAVVLICGERPNPNDPASVSWVRRVASPQPTDRGTALMQAAWYGERGIWYDALDFLAEARRDKTDDKALTNIWTEFLKSAGLGEIATESVQF